jgi:hypothetical protein
MALARTSLHETVNNYRLEIEQRNRLGGSQPAQVSKSHLAPFDQQQNPLENWEGLFI